MSLKTNISNQDLSEYVAQQLNNFFPSKESVLAEDIYEIHKSAFERLDYCFSKINVKYFFDGKNTIFSHFNGDQYSMYLYMMSYIANKNFNDINIAEKLYLLNKALHGIDAFYEVELPKIFIFIHPVGTVLGRATYSDYLTVYQRCGVGTNKNLQPQLGSRLTLHPGASILGNSRVGDNCSIGADSLVMDMNLEENTVYVGNPKSFFLYKKDILNSMWVL
jgi:serine O-acetyltransferase